VLNELAVMQVIEVIVVDTTTMNNCDESPEARSKDSEKGSDEESGKAPKYETY